VRKAFDVLLLTAARCLWNLRLFPPEEGALMQAVAGRAWRHRVSKCNRDLGHLNLQRFQYLQ